MKSVLMLFVFILASNVYASENIPLANSLPPGVEPPPFMAPAAQVAPIEKVSQGVYRIGEIIINKSEKSVSFPAHINMNKGLLEYVLVRNGGKTHESLLRTAIEPYSLQVALLLIGMEGTDKPLDFQGAPEKPQGTAVTISLELQNAAGKMISLSPEEMCTKNVDNKFEPINNLTWIFTGSVVRDGRFLAQTEGSMIALYHDPVALIDNSSPGGESDKIWFVKEDKVPPVGTPVTVIIKAVK